MGFVRKVHETDDNAHEIRIGMMMSMNKTDKDILENKAKMNPQRI